jgi:HSP20 family protein
MRLSRWQPFVPVWNQLQQMQDEMNRLFDRWGSEGGRGTLGVAYPALNVWEEGERLSLEAELPGMDMKDLEIYVTGNDQLTIKGERKPVAPGNGAKTVRHRQERGFAKFSRTLTLPFPVNPDNVQARFDNGVLRLELAKHESARPRKIQVKAE